MVIFAVSGEKQYVYFDVDRFDKSVTTAQKQLKSKGFFAKRGLLRAANTQTVENFQSSRLDSSKQIICLARCLTQGVGHASPDLAGCGTKLRLFAGKAVAG